MRKPTLFIFTLKKLSSPKSFRVNICTLIYLKIHRYQETNTINLRKKSFLLKFNPHEEANAFHFNVKIRILHHFFSKVPNFFWINICTLIHPYSSSLANGFQPTTLPINHWQISLRKIGDKLCSDWLQLRVTD